MEAHKKIAMDTQLPYSGSKYDEVAEIIPEGKFIPI